MPNRLAQETSPYLQQHADNPVDWYPWGEEALALAKREDKPILLSVGYSACHWCHVMAHESFEDAETAALMNRLYVNIKVDREERPDLDQIYQLAHQMLTQRSGGWPLTMFLTPEGAPFFGGTYFPKSARFGLPGFGQLLERVERAYREQREAIEEQNRSLSGALARTVASDRAHHSEFDLDAAERMRELLASNFDAEDGGFGGAPKFPHPTDLEFLLRRFQARGDTGARDMALHTLRKMAEGGIYDQLGGGFCRYSVDAHWNIPHFEKMLYDNGPLLRLCADAWAISGDPLFRKVAEETAAWVMREMQAPEGGYYSSLDADSEHEEGKFYVWHRHEVETLLTPEQYAVAVRHYGLDRSPNFEGKDWHLHVARPLAEVAMALRKDLGECERLLTEARARLWEARERRVRPGRDEKILTSWNALTIDGMAHAAAVFGRSDWLGSARRALDFVRGTLWRDGRLLATYKDGRAHLNAYLDDHAFLLNALLELAQADFRAEELGFAEDLAEALLERFEDREGGGFFFTSHDHERLIHRAKPGHDNATPSGNALAAFGLQRLGHLTGEVRYLEAAERALSLFYPQFSRHPAGYASFLACLEEHQHAPAVVVLRGPEDAARGWLAELRKAYRPTTIALLVGRAEAGLPPALDKPAGDRVNAWICSGVTCLPPVEDLAEVERVLSSGFVE